MSIDPVKPSTDRLNHTIGRAIRGYRLQRGLSQVKLAQALEVDVKTVSRIENGEFLPSLETVISLSRVFALPIDVVLGLAHPSENGSSETTSRAVARLEALEDRVSELERLLGESAAECRRAMEVAARAEHLARQAFGLHTGETLRKTS